MIQIVWRYEVRDQNRGQFELFYGPGGVWSTLFAKAPGFRGTALLRDVRGPHRYLTIDSWDTEGHRQDFLKQHGAEYAAMAAALRELLDSESEIGVYKLLGEAVVRPVPRRTTARASRPRRSR